MAFAEELRAHRPQAGIAAMNGREGELQPVAGRDDRDGRRSPKGEDRVERTTDVLLLVIRDGDEADTDSHGLLATVPLESIRYHSWTYQALCLY